jgi:transposase
MISKGKAAAFKIKHAHVLLKTDANGPAWPDSQIAAAYCCSLGTVVNIRQRFVENGLETALNRKSQSRPSRTPILDGEKEARLIALSCRKPLEGRSSWTLRLLADQLMALDIVDSISHETVRVALKKTNSNRTSANAG